jgi:hypothetical protein
LHKGIDRWALAMRWQGRVGRATHLFTLTCARDENEALWGEWQRVMHALKQRWPKLRFFAWLELTRRGRIHYHALCINVPYLRRGTPAQVIERLWGHGHVDQQVRQGSGSLDSMVAYVRGYVKKQGAKKYQQDYEDVPPGMRAFNTSFKRYSATLLDQHLDRWDSLWSQGVVTLVGRFEHRRNDRCAPTPGQLELEQRRARYRAGRRMGRIWANAGDSREFAAAPIKEGTLGATRAEQLRVMQAELFSEHREWHRRVYELPW